jgi:hypothetical protein
MHPLSVSFNAAVMTMARMVCRAGYDVAHDGSAPESLAELRAHIAATGRILVDGRNCDATIFADAEHNYAFRAWHDWTHWRYQLPFTIAGETAVALQQIADLRAVYGAGAETEVFSALIWEEIVGQAEHFAATGSFPPNQRVFAEAYLAGERI